MKRIAETDLILNADGSAYHLNLLPGDVADTVITVGDQDRVAEITRYFDYIELKKGKREFITHTGRIGNKRLTVISTGIGTDNIDIVLNELDALVNIDFNTRLPNTNLRSLNIIRIGTSGAVQADIPIDSLLASTAAFGLDALMHYYKQDISALDQELLTAFQSALPNDYKLLPYIASADSSLLTALAQDVPQGITITAPGFYAPQGRQVRAENIMPDLMTIVQNFNSTGQRITNLEMETAGIYGLAAALGHKAISFNVILANRAIQTFSKQPAIIMDHHIKQLLQKINTAL
jgi:uridine phosphorylase